MCGIIYYVLHERYINILEVSGYFSTKACVHGSNCDMIAF